jgi:hypothetical protein
VPLRLHLLHLLHLRRRLLHLLRRPVWRLHRRRR